MPNKPDKCSETTAEQTTPNPKKYLEIQRAHDILVQIITDQELRDKLPAVALQTMMVSTDVLCWVLNHDHNQKFNQRIDAAEAWMRDMGFELSQIQ